MSSTPNYYVLESSTQSLIDFFAEATSVENSDVYKAQQECVLARYALRDKTVVYSTLKEYIQKKAASDPKEALVLLSRLDIAAEKMIFTVEKVINLLKRAAEIDIASSTKFDGVQLFHIVQQIPVIIAALVTPILEQHLDSVIARAVTKEICDKLALELDRELKVITVDPDGNSGAGGDSSGVTQERLEQMLKTVP